MNILPIILIDGIPFASCLSLPAAHLPLRPAASHVARQPVRDRRLSRRDLRAIDGGRPAHLDRAAAAARRRRCRVDHGSADRAVVRAASTAGRVIGPLTTFALFLILEDVVRLIWGIQPYLIDGPFHARPGSLAGIASPTIVDRRSSRRPAALDRHPSHLVRPPGHRRSATARWRTRSATTPRTIHGVRSVHSLQRWAAHSRADDPIDSYAPGTPSPAHGSPASARGAGCRSSASRAAAVHLFWKSSCS